MDQHKTHSNRLYASHADTNEFLGVKSRQKGAHASVQTISGKSQQSIVQSTNSEDPRSARFLCLSVGDWTRSTAIQYVTVIVTMGT